ncbi:MAG: ATP-dependent Clp protease adaptor ClpS [Planctomycetota bacterium]|jgi:ATP-dependent Clp protease adaptor protein ClpS|nr:MAG: ATP-dependent Clp protease adaptor ClpS [Planctomycetota bacterium]RLS96061.1 MAG: ATP-dependent Clp protease adaptor ClpS [Planctomycetota bacterium]
MSNSAVTPAPALPTTATKLPAPAPSAPVEKLPPWNVLLHNDEVNDMGFVVESLCRFVRLSVPAATRCTMEAHKKGLSLVVATHREHAELIAEQLTSLRLTVTLERAP